MNALVYVNHQPRVAWNMANFEAFCRVISSSKNILFPKSDNNNVVNLPLLLILAMTGVLAGTSMVGAAIAVMLFAKRV